MLERDLECVVPSDWFVSIRVDLVHHEWKSH
jgi:hypothetical protein